MSELLLPPEHRYAKIIKERHNEDGSELSILNLGPTHPATHGIFQNILLMDGEKILEAEPTIGYIHRAFEKIAENRPFYQITPLTDRMNYCSSPINNLGWWMTLEKLLGVEVPKRAQYLRVIVMELARIADHLICNSILGVDTGAYTGFLYVFQFREKIYEIYEEICGARLTTNMGRIGGFAAGVDYDVRVAQPYSSYEDFDFIVPVGKSGDTYDRFCVRNAEVWESLSIIKQALAKMPAGNEYHADVPEYYLPPKEDVYTTMESLIYHFKIVMGEVPVPVGEVYHPVEGANGEIGFYLVSDGSRTPYRLHFRRPCFIYYQAYPEMIKGSMLSDAIVILSSLNVIAGELDA